MKDTWIYVIAGAVLIGFLVVFKYNTQIATGQKILTPQPTQNYGGYLQATTAPAVSQALSGAISGFGSTIAGWLGSSSQPSIATAGISAAGAVGAGVAPRLISGGPAGSAAPNAPAQLIAPIGPITDPNLSYNATDYSSFDYSGLASNNAYDPTASLGSFATIDPNSGGYLSA
jgi:hypothetical protein